MAIKKYVTEKIVFPHIQKTAGTSLIRWIQRHYYFDEILFSASTWSELLRLPKKSFENKRFVRGHFGSGILNIFGAHNGFVPITILRNPVERVISHYWHLKYAPDAQANLAFVKEALFSIENFLEHPETQYIASNYQTANLSAIVGVRHDAVDEPEIRMEYSPPDIEVAKSFIRSCEVVGISEDINSFVMALSARFGFFADNALPKTRSYRQPIAFSDEIINKIRSLNDADFELYHYAKSHAEASCKSRKYYSLGALKNPCTVGSDGVLKWVAGEPYFGKGWSDCMDGVIKHIWSLQPDASLQLSVNEGEHYAMIFSLYRFVANIQQECFSVLCNDKEVLVVPVFSNDGNNLIYAAALGQAKTDKLNITFRVSKLISFHKITDGKDQDRVKRGIALCGVTLLPCSAPSIDAATSQNKEILNLHPPKA